MTTRYFRAGVGIVLYTESGDIALFERAQAPLGFWQFPQGGIDHGESPEETLWRELKEEVGLTKDSVLSVHDLPGWYPYQDAATIDDHSLHRIGQIHRWFFLKLNPEVTIDLSLAVDKEFLRWRWASFSEAVALTSPHKIEVYKTLERYFKETVLNL